MLILTQQSPGALKNWTPPPNLAVSVNVHSNKAQCKTLSVFESDFWH